MSDPSMCDSVKMTATLECGCPVEDNENSCELCPDGLEDSTLISESFDMTCVDSVTNSLFYISSDSEMCDNGKMVGAL